MDPITENALKTGREHAKDVLALRTKALELRKRALGPEERPIIPTIRTAAGAEKAMAEPRMARTAGHLVAEGDSWFNYPMHDVVQELEDRHAYEVESVAHYGDFIEEMAYEKGQLTELARQIEKLMRLGVTPKAVLLSGGGNDVAGTEFGMLLNHALSPLPGFNSNVLDGIFNQRIFNAYVTILNGITWICEDNLGEIIPILMHGYDYPVPDGRGFLGGWAFLPGPWMEPGFRRKGYKDLDERKKLARDLIDRFNSTLQNVATLDPFKHVHFIDLRNTLQTGPKYVDWWANELHPTELGFRAVADKFAAVLATLP